MYKSKLQELCQKRSLELPEYAVVKDGVDHMPSFMASVNVHGQCFQTPEPCRSSKEAQNSAARIAFDYLNSPAPVPSSTPSPTLVVSTEAPLPVDSPPQIQPLSVDDVPRLYPISPLPSSLPTPPKGLLTTKCNAKTIPVKEEIKQENCDDTTQCSTNNNIAIGSNYKDVMHMYKNLLQQHAQKENIALPVYTPEAEGPPHARRFKSKVFFNGESYETLEYFPTLKEAEQAVAKIACQALSVDVVQEDKGLYKNLLQDFALKKNLKCPKYETVNSKMSHNPIFVCTVEVGSDTFQGVEAKSKKQAESNAAKVAYYALTKGCPPTNSLNATCTNIGPFGDNLSQNIPPTTTIEKHQDATDEESQIHAKRAKPSPANVDLNARLNSNHPSDDSKKEDAAVLEPTVENPSSIEWKTVIFPRKSNWPIPEDASVMPYSNEQWVAYRVKLGHK